MKDEALMSINEAVAKGIERVRQPQWATPEDHLKIDIIYGKHGPWFHLFAPFNQECNGRDPVDLLCLGMDDTERVWLAYSGPLPDSDEYRAAVARFTGCLADRHSP